jgi:DNA-binding NtrC family response regulator
MERSKILFVDDEPNVTAALKRALRQEPYEVFTADSAVDALQILAINDIDVVISDERMPGMSGSVFLGQVRQTYPDTVRIILSGQANLEDVVRAINEGEIYRFFIKPFNATDLGVTIRQAIQHKQLVKQSRRLLREYQKQVSVMDELERANPGITDLQTDEDGAILVDDDDTSIELLLQEIEQQFQRAGNNPVPESLSQIPARAAGGRGR